MMVNESSDAEQQERTADRKVAAVVEIPILHSTQTLQAMFKSAGEARAILDRYARERENAAAGNRSPAIFRFSDDFGSEFVVAFEDAGAFMIDVLTPDYEGARAEMADRAGWLQGLYQKTRDLVAAVADGREANG